MNIITILLLKKISLINEAADVLKLFLIKNGVGIEQVLTKIILFH